MAFVEDRFPVNISRGAIGGPNSKTDIVRTGNGQESRNVVWPIPLRSWDVSHGVRTQAQHDELLAFHLCMEGRAIGFRFKDWSDFRVTFASGVLGTGNGDGGPIYQLHKKYVTGATTRLRAIAKPVATPAPQLRRNGSPMTPGSGPGQYALDITTGRVTLVADASANATSITVGTLTTVVLPTNPGTLVAGQRLYLSQFAGADAARVNALAHTIDSVSGAGPFTFVLQTNTAGRTITLGTGKGEKFPQVADALTWQGEFDIPARFDTDAMRTSIEAFEKYTVNQIMIVELLEAT